MVYLSERNEQTLLRYEIESMSPYLILDWIDESNSGTMLDIGTRDCSYAAKFVEKGYLVDAIDPNDVLDNSLVDGITFKKTTLEDFETDKNYNLVVASLVSHLVDYTIQEFITRLKSLCADDGLIYVTLIGDEDEWASSPRAKALSMESAHSIISDLGLVPVYAMAEWEHGSLYNGDSKFWHVLTFVLSKKPSS